MLGTKQLLALSALLFTLAILATSQSTSDASKRGIAYLGTPYPSDYHIFTSRSSPFTWYYNWSPYPVGNPTSFSNLEFIPLLHNTGSLARDLRQLSRLPDSTKHVLTFNEPDHGTDGGGSDISPADAAKAYVNEINPLSVANGGRFLISHPSTTGTLSGLNWLQRFNESCFDLEPNGGCHIDFVATHFYGDFPALASWLGTLNEYYNTNTESNYLFWITELALPQQDAEVTEVMMNTTLPYLDELDYVEKYAWFGINRQENANGWTGSGVSLLDDDGDLTELGALYLGGEAAGYEQGMSASSGSGEENIACGLGWRSSWLALVGTFVVLMGTDAL